MFVIVSRETITVWGDCLVEQTFAKGEDDEVIKWEMVMYVAEITDFKAWSPADNLLLINHK